MMNSVSDSIDSDLLAAEQEAAAIDTLPGEAFLVHLQEFCSQIEKLVTSRLNPSKWYCRLPFGASQHDST